MHELGRALAVGCLLVLVGCYHATVETGLRPGPITLERKWASSWIYGLVPPPTVETMERCPSGVARVETRLSFLNQLVNALTFGIYTPMEIVVTCADERSATGRTPVLDRVGFAAAVRSGEPFFMALE